MDEWQARTGKGRLIDHDLMQGYTSATLNDHPFRPLETYAQIFRFENKTLCYIGAKHDSGLESPTFKAVAAAFEEYKPEIIILETIFSNRERYISEVIKNTNSGFVKCGESTYAAYLAISKGINFIGGEPHDKDLFAKLKDTYSNKELICFYFLRALPHDREKGEVSEENLTEFFEKYLQHFPFVPESEHPSFAEFLDWNENHSFGLPSLMERKPYHCAPFKEHDSTYFNRMAADVSKVRDEHLLEVIEDAMNKHNSVMVVYGNGHLAQGRKALEAAYGKAESRQF